VSSQNRAYFGSQNRGYHASENRAFGFAGSVPAQEIAANILSRGLSDDDFRFETQIAFATAGMDESTADHVIVYGQLGTRSEWCLDGMARMLRYWLDGEDPGAGLTSGPIGPSGGSFAISEDDTADSKTWDFWPHESGPDWPTEDLVQSGPGGTVTVTTGSLFGHSMGTNRVGLSVRKVYYNAEATIIASGTEYPYGYCFYMPVDDGGMSPVVVAVNKQPRNADTLAEINEGDTLGVNVTRMIVVSYFSLKVET
jgi:hypothetical protein